MTEDLQARLIRDLVTESNEALDEFDRELLLLEKGEASDDALNRMFRVIHSLKGTSGCLGLNRIESMGHAGENLLSLLRDRVVQPTPHMVTTLLTYADALRAMLRNVETTGSEGGEDFAELAAALRLLCDVSSPAAPVEKAAFGLFDDDEPAPPPPAAQPEPDAPPVPKAPAPAIEAVSSTPAPVQSSSAETQIRVDVEQLDGMMDLVGELVLARNQIMQFTGRVTDSSLIGATQRLNIITTKLQETVMKTRMQPIGNVWGKFPRIVRDVSRELGKDVRLVMEGKDTDLDRNIIEAIKDPMTHLVRNAIDHGLETPAQRTAAGKPEQGLLRLRAFHEGGQVNIEIYDDGAGINREKVLAKAIQKGLVPSGEASQLSDREVYALLFAPGFSTAEKITNISGRGVGMDVVKRNIERIGGSVDIQSETGRSTTLRIKIPLTLAIIPALLIRCGGRRYAIPQVSLVELVRIDAENRSRSIEHINGASVYRLRGNLLPLLFLRQQLGLAAAAQNDDSVFLLVLQAEGRQFGLVVDSIQDTEEIVVKPLGKELKGLSVYAGATIMGDGCVALILDVLGIARRSGIVQEANRLDSVLMNDAEKQTASQEKQSLILFSLGRGRQASIPLSSVARLEEFADELIEWSGGSEVVQYRGEIMPLIRVGRTLGMAGEHDVDEDSKLRVIVYHSRGRNVGLVVDQILDTVEEAVQVQKTRNRPGILGSAVVKRRVTDFIDVDAVLEMSGAVCFEGATV